MQPDGLNERSMSAAPAPGEDGAKILLIEDEDHITELVQMYLHEAGFRVLVAADGLTGLELHLRERPDLILLDVMLPGMDGWAVCERIRQVAQTPIMMLTARRMEYDRVRGLDLGADDYLTKPFSPRELVSRVRAILRRTRPLAGQTATPSDHLAFDGLLIFPAAQRVEVDGQVVALTSREYDLLITMASAPGHVFSREELFSRVWNYDYLGGSRMVDVYIGTLRKKVERDPSSPRFLKTIHRVGYVFDPAVAEPGAERA